MTYAIVSTPIGYLSFSNYFDRGNPSLYRVGTVEVRSCEEDGSIVSDAYNVNVVIDPSGKKIAGVMGKDDSLKPFVLDAMQEVLTEEFLMTCRNAIIMELHLRARKKLWSTESAFKIAQMEMESIRQMANRFGLAESIQAQEEFMASKRD